MLDAVAQLLDRHRRAQERARADLTPAAWEPPYIGGASSATSAADRIVRVHTLHEAGEEGNDLGPYLDVVRQVVTYPTTDEEVFRFDYSEAENPDEDWIEIYFWLTAGSPWGGVAAWFAANGITLGEGFTVAEVTAVEEYLVTDGDTEYQVLSDESTGWDWVVSRPGVPQVTYSDTLDDEEELVTFAAYPDPEVMAELTDAQGELIEGRELAEFYAVDQYLLAQPYGDGWVAWRASAGAVVVKVTDTSSVLTVIKQTWTGSGWSDLGNTFTARPHPELGKDDYAENDRYLAWRIGDEWFVGPLVDTGTEGYTGTRTVVEDISFDADGCVDGFTTKNFYYQDGLLKTVT